MIEKMDSSISAEMKAKGAMGFLSMTEDAYSDEHR